MREFIRERVSHVTAAEAATEDFQLALRRDMAAFANENQIIGCSISAHDIQLTVEPKKN